MSGWDPNTRTYDLTATKARHWHRTCHCGADSLGDLLARHLKPAGFRAVPGAAQSAFLRLTLDDPPDATGNHVQGLIFVALRGEPESANLPPSVGES